MARFVSKEKDCLGTGMSPRRKPRGDMPVCADQIWIWFITGAFKYAGDVNGQSPTLR